MHKLISSRSPENRHTPSTSAEFLGYLVEQKLVKQNQCTYIIEVEQDIGPGPSGSFNHVKLRQTTQNLLHYKFPLPFASAVANRICSLNSIEKNFPPIHNIHGMCRLSFVNYQLGCRTIENGVKSDGMFDTMQMN